MHCPKCGGDNIRMTPVTTTSTTTKVKGFGFIKACLGWLLFSLPGILCGLCGMGKGKSKITHHTRMVHVCQDCGKEF